MKRQHRRTLGGQRRLDDRAEGRVGRPVRERRGRHWARGEQRHTPPLAAADRRAQLEVGEPASGIQLVVGVKGEVKLLGS